VLVAAAVCPHPPVLVPEVARGAAGELASVRDSAVRAVRRLARADHDVLAVVGGAGRNGRYPLDAAGTLAPYGVPVRTGGPGQPVLPLSLTIGAWLLDRAGVRPGLLQAVAVDEPPTGCLELGAGLAGGAERVALLAMGDGTCRLTEKAPGYVDPRAGPYDDAVAAALACADLAALAGLDPKLSAELGSAGRAVWQVLAGAATGRSWRAELSARSAPYGVSYLVAVWEPT
jgi:hypothetical protein